MSLEPTVQKSEIERVVIVSDHAGLSRALAIYIMNAMTCRVERYAPGTNQCKERLKAEDEHALLVLALCSPSCDPAVTLSESGYRGDQTHIPVVIVSDAPLRSAPSGTYTQVGFPFDLQSLNQVIDRIVSYPSWPHCSGMVGSH